MNALRFFITYVAILTVVVGGFMLAVGVVLLMLAVLPHVWDVVGPPLNAIAGIIHGVVDAFPVWGCANRMCPTN